MSNQMPEIQSWLWLMMKNQVKKVNRNKTTNIYSYGERDGGII